MLPTSVVATNLSKQCSGDLQILMNWSQEELEQWTVTQQQKEEDSEAVERYQAQDRSKIKELDLTVERMNRTVAIRRTELERQVTDTQSAQMQLQKAADDFSRLHKVFLSSLTLPCIHALGRDASQVPVSIACGQIATFCRELATLNHCHTYVTISVGTGSQQCTVLPEWCHF